MPFRFVCPDHPDHRMNHVEDVLIHGGASHEVENPHVYFARVRKTFQPQPLRHPDGRIREEIAR